MKEENFNEKENCSSAFKYCDGVFLNGMWKQRKDRKSRQQRNQADNRSRRGYELR